jgi:hypothetical protein
MASREEQEYSTQAPAGYIGDFLKGDIFPYAKAFLGQQFGELGGDNTSPFTYTGERIADFDPREVQGMQLTDQAIGSYLPYLGEQSNLLSEAAGTMRSAADLGGQGISAGLAAGRGLTGEAAGVTRGAGPDFSAARGGLGRAELSGYGSTGMFDPSRQVSNFYNPFEEQVVQQTLDDVSERFGKADIGLRDQAIGAGAFGGARSRLTQEELAEDAARGAAQQVGAIRSQGFQGATNAAQQAFEAQQRRQQGLAGLQGQLAAREGQFGSAEAQAALRQGQQLGQLGQTEFGMGFQGGTGIANLGQRLGQGLGALGQQYQGLAQTLPTLQGQDISRLMAVGGLGRGKDQSGLDLDYQNFVGQYNLPMQTLQNVGALTASLGPLAGGYGYAGGGPPPQGSNYNSSVYAPVTGSLPAQSGLPGSIGYNPAAAPAPAPAPAGGFSAGIFGGLGGLGSLSGLDFSGYPYG